MTSSDSSTILLVEDEPSLAEAVRYNLEREGLDVVVAEDGGSGLRLFRAARPTLVILDLMLPGMPGLDVCRTIRSESNVPIIILTAKNSEADKVVGLELGADDYVTKPFSVRELVSRVRAQLRRTSMSEGETVPDLTVSGGPVLIDAARHEVRVRGQIVGMTPKEFSILQILVERRGRLVTRDFLIDEAWGPEYSGETKTLDVHIKRLRQKVERDPGRPEHILTIRGLGYKFEG